MMQKGDFLITNYISEVVMVKNIHPVERIMRISLGVILISFAFVGPANLWFLLGLVPLITGFVGWCPLYAIIGFNSCYIGKHSGGSKTEIKVK